MAADNVSITPGTGQLIAADGVTDGTLGNVSVQFVKLMDGTIGSTNKATVNASGQLVVDVANAVAVTFSGNSTVVGPTNDGSAAANPPVLIAGTIDGTGTGNISIPQISSTGRLSTNLTQINGGNISLGQTTGNLSFPVVLASNQGNLAITGNVGLTGNVTLGNGTNAIGNVTAITSALPAGTNALGNITALISALPVGTNAIGNITNIGSVSGNVSIVGPVAGNVTVAGSPVQSAKRAVTAEAVPNGNNTVVLPVTDAVGKAIMMPYANKENWVYGNATIGNTSATTIIAAQGAGNKIYITGLYLGNTGNTTVIATTNSTGNLPFVVPSGGGSNLPFHTPLTVAGNTAFTITASGNTTSLIVSATGYFGT